MVRPSRLVLLSCGHCEAIPNPVRSMPSTTWLRSCVGLTVVGLVALQVASLGPWTGSLWGVHFPAFLPFPLALVSWIAMLGLAAWLLLRPGDDPSDPSRTADLQWALALLILYTAAAWIFRSQQTLLGDTWSLMIDLPKGQDFHPRQPLTLFLQQKVLQLVASLSGEEVSRPLAQRAVAMGSVAAGTIFLAICVRIGRVVADRSRLEARWITLGLISQGYCLLLFGYVENYTFVLVANAAVMWTGLAALREPRPLTPPLVLWVLALALHLSSIILLPALVFLVATAARHRNRRKGLVLDLGLAAIALVLLDQWMRSRGLPLLTALGDILEVGRRDHGGGNGLAYTLSARHLRDFANQHLLMGPFASILALAVLAWGVATRTRRPAFWFLALASAASLGSAFLVSEPLLGYARDWDLFAPSGVVLMVTALAGVTWSIPGDAARLGTLKAVAAVSVIHLATWVAFNHSETLAARRFETLPLGLGRTQVVLGNWHLRNDRLEEAERRFRMALEEQPYNANAYGLLGALYLRQKKYEDAVQAYRAALVTRPDKIPYRSNLAGALMALDRYEDARPHIETLARQDPTDPSYPLVLVDIHERAGREAERLESLQRVADLYAGALEEDPQDVQTALDYGVLMAENGRLEDALRLFLYVVQTTPDSDAGLFNVAGILVQLGRGPEAVPYLQRMLELYPTHGRAAQARAWIQEHGS